MAYTNTSASTAPGWFSIDTDSNTYGINATTIDVSLGMMDNYGLGTWDWTMNLQRWNGKTYEPLLSYSFTGYVSETSSSHRSFNISKACPTSGSYRVVAYLRPRLSGFKNVYMYTTAFKVSRL